MACLAGVYGCPREEAPGLPRCWLEVIRREGIVYVGLDALTDTTVAGAVGISMFADLVSVAGHIYKHGVEDPAGDPKLSGGSATMPTISLHAGEIKELIGNRAKARQVAGNFNTLLMLRVKELATAEMLTDQLGQ